MGTARQDLFETVEEGNALGAGFALVEERAEAFEEENREESRGSEQFDKGER